MKIGIHTYTHLKFSLLSFWYKEDRCGFVCVGREFYGESDMKYLSKFL